MLELKHLINHLGDLPVDLPAAAVDADAVPSGDMVTAKARYLDGDPALAAVVVDGAHDSPLVPCGFLGGGLQLWGLVIGGFVEDWGRV